MFSYYETFLRNEKPVKRAVKNIKKLAVSQESTEDEEEPAPMVRSRKLKGREIDYDESIRYPEDNATAGNRAAAYHAGGFHAPPGLQM